VIDANEEQVLPDRPTAAVELAEAAFEWNELRMETQRRPDPALIERIAATMERMQAACNVWREVR
jgi:hypothetical protein